MQPTIYIIGVGAIGMTLAVYLQQAGKQVILVRGRQGQPTETEACITLECSGQATQTACIPIRSLDELERLNGLVVLTNKSFGNQDLARRLSGKTDQSPLVLLQNGLGVEDPFLDAGFPEVYRCVLLATSQVVAPYTVSYKPVAASPIGWFRGQAANLDILVEQLTTPLFPFRAEATIQQVIWEKVIANCVFNAICPLLEVDNGYFHRNALAMKMAREVIQECISVAAEVGVILTSDEVEQRLLQISQRSDGQLISTLVDINHGRETEIETLNLGVARLADRLGKPQLANRTRLLGEMTFLKAELSRK